MLSGPHKELDIMRDYVVPTIGLTALFLGLSFNTGEDPIPETALALALGLLCCAVIRIFDHLHFKQLRGEKERLRKEAQIYRTRFYEIQERVPGHLQHAQFLDAPLQIYMPYIIPARIRLIYSRRQA